MPDLQNLRSWQFYSTLCFSAVFIMGGNLTYFWDLLSASEMKWFVLVPVFFVFVFFVVCKELSSKLFCMRKVLLWLQICSLGIKALLSWRSTFLARYYTTVGVGGSGVGVSKMLKFFMWWARRCQASFPVPVTGLVSFKTWPWRKVRQILR